MEEPLQNEISAGVVVYIEDNNVRKYLLVKKARGKKQWEFPKGKIGPGERVSHTAVRELKEETGIVGKLTHGFAHRLTYDYHIGKIKVHKKVMHFLLKADNQSVTLSKEHLSFVWLPYSEARKRVLFDNKQNVLDTAEEFLSGGKHVKL